MVLNYKKSFFFFLFTMVLGLNYVVAQLSAPEVESVYGGRINAITGITLSSDTSRIFISTESANSVFYADVYTPSVGSPTYGIFKVMPSLDENANYGSAIQKIAAHSESGCFYFIDRSGLLSTHPTNISNPASTVPEVTSVSDGQINDLLIRDSYLFFIRNNTEFHYGILNSSGIYTENGIITIPFVSWPQIVFNSFNGSIYLYESSSSPAIYKSSDDYTNFSVVTTFSNMTLSSLSSSIEWRALGIGPDGVLFLGGDDGSSKFMSSSSDDGITWNTINTGANGVAGNNIVCSGSSSSYNIYFASIYSTDKGNTWQNLGNVSFETHPNDGAVFTDPNNSSIVYLTSDQGIASSTDGGANIFEIDDGVEAVQVSDFDMNSSKTDGWLASKSGVRKVSSFLTSPSWSRAMFPNSDGSPYYSVEMKGDDPSTAYAGNVRVYKTVDDGNSWTRIFSAEDAPYNLSGIGSRVEAIEVCPFDNNIVMAGYHVQDVEKGGLFCSMDDGATWNQILIEASAEGPDVDVNDIIFTIEGTDTVAYIGVYYDLSSTQGRSIYRIVKSGSTWTAAQNMNSGNTSTGSLIVATIEDLSYSSSRDTIFACGTDAGNNHPIAYYKIISGNNLWTPFATSGFPFIEGKDGKAIEFGNDTVFCAVDNEIYYITGAYDGNWTVGYTYANGTEINVLYYDELLVGTGTGIYGQVGTGTTSIGTEVGQVNSFELKQNYPNPFNPVTKIEYVIPEKSEVSLEVYDIRGRMITRLINKDLKEEGSYSIEFNGRNLPSGIYFYRILAQNSNQFYTQSKKMILIK